MTDKEAILVVDDEADVRALLKAMLEDEYDIDLASNGEEAVHRLNDKQYASVLIDVALPGALNGFEILNEIRRLAPSTKAILITGLVLDEDSRKRASEADGFISKPFSIEELKDVLSRELAKR